MSENKTLKAALLIIGNEILSGRTQDTNTAWIAQKLNSQGIVLAEVRVVPDIESLIIKAVNELRVENTYLFTTGGIGPTHDDITTESVAKAFGVKFGVHKEARDLLLKHYGTEAELTPAREKMAVIPEGAKLIYNPVSSAPGFILENVYVMAGVPRIMQAMLDNVAGSLRTGKPILSRTITCGLAESVIAEALGNLQKKYAEIDVGSYPHFRAGGHSLSLVLRSTDENLLDEATQELATIIQELGDTPQVMAVQGT